MTDYTFHIGARGFLVVVIQQAIENALGRRIEGGVDGRFGSGTATEYTAFAKALEPDVRRRLADEGAMFGKVGQFGFDALGIEWPDLFPRCLQLTMTFEGTGFAGAVGPRQTGDNAGVTFGSIGFTSGNGELQEMLREARAMEHSRFDAIALKNLSDKDRLELHNRTANGAGARLFEDWALDGTRSVRAPVRNFLTDLGCEDWFKMLQMDRAARNYWARAVKQVQRLFATPVSARPFALLLDIGVQNGGLKDPEMTDLEVRFRNGIYDNERDRMVEICNTLIARLRGAGRPSNIIDDVRSRKGTILTGQGTVHGDAIKVGAYAL